MSEVCPNCRAPRADGAEDCPSCGVYFHKLKEISERIYRTPPALRRKRARRAAFAAGLVVLGWALLKEWVGDAAFGWAETKYEEVQEEGRREAQRQKWSEELPRRLAEKSAGQDGAQARAAQAAAELARGAKVPPGFESRAAAAELELRSVQSQDRRRRQAGGP
jgi:hypothetical protein